MPDEYGHLYEDEERTKIFWTDDCPEYAYIKGGLFFRTMGLGKFIDRVEQDGYKVVGIKVDDSNECELLTIKKEDRQP